jgi:hypothetical protein
MNHQLIAQTIHAAILDLEKTNTDDDKLTTYEILLVQTLEKIVEDFERI